MNITKFVDFLNKTKNLNIDSSYYLHIEKWKHWWQGYVDDIHNVKELAAQMREVIAAHAMLPTRPQSAAWRILLRQFLLQSPCQTLRDAWTYS